MLTELVEMMNRSSPEVRDPVRAGGDLPYKETFYPLGFSVEISTNDRAVLQSAAHLWSHFHPRQVAPTLHLNIVVEMSSSAECPPAPVYHGFRYLMSLVADRDNYCVCDLRTGFAFGRFGTATVQHKQYFHYHFLDAMALGLVSAVHATALHAGCVSLRGQGYLLCGASGAGKSTLAYACARSGFTYISDDCSYLLPKAYPPRVLGQSHKIRFRTHSRELFPELRSREETPRMEGKPSIEILTADLTGIQTSEEADIHHLILLDRQASGSATLTPLATHLALERFHSNLYPTPELRSDQIASLGMLRQVRAYELTYSLLDDAIRQLATLAEAPDQRR